MKAKDMPFWCFLHNVLWVLIRVRVMLPNAGVVAVALAVPRFTVVFGHLDEEKRWEGQGGRETKDDTATQTQDRSKVSKVMDATATDMNMFDVSFIRGQ